MDRNQLPTSRALDKNHPQYVANGARDHREPWRSEHIPKPLRKGKSFEEIEELRRNRYYGARALDRFGREQCTQLGIVDENGLLIPQAYNDLLTRSLEKMEESADAVEAKGVQHEDEEGEAGTV